MLVVSCGWWHTAAIVREGEAPATRLARLQSGGTLYLWGCGETGQLGNGNEQNMSLPRPPKSLLFKACHSVSCGKLHTLAIVEHDRYKKAPDPKEVELRWKQEEQTREEWLERVDEEQMRRRINQVRLSRVQGCLCVHMYIYILHDVCVTS